MTKRFLVTIGIMGTLSVVFGSVGTHLLRDVISDEQLIIFNTANEYLMFHTLALLGLTALSRLLSRSYLNTIYYFFVIGIVLFSGTLIISSLKELTGFNPEARSILAPIGGIMLFIGWITIIMAGFSYKHKKSHH